MDYSEGQNNETPFHCQLISAALLHRDKALYCVAQYSLTHGPCFRIRNAAQRVSLDSGHGRQRNDHFIARLDELEAAKSKMARDRDAAAVGMQRPRFVQID